MTAKRKKFDIEENKEAAIRINKYLSDSGFCSRREADTHVAAGEVFIDGEKAEMGSKVMPGQTVTVNGKPVELVEKQVLIAFYKPVGIVCTTDRREPDNIVDYINYETRIYPIGRLDKASEGLILLTNDGDIVNKILRAGNNHEKEYQVEVNKPLTPEFIAGMSNGVPILDTITKPCKITPTGKTTFNIVLTQGLNRQIRRMCEYFDYRVLSLRRIRIMHINLGRLNPGTYRNLTDWELEELKEVLKTSTKLSAKEVKLEKRAEINAKEKFERKFKSNEHISADGGKSFRGEKHKEGFGKYKTGGNRERSAGNDGRKTSGGFGKKGGPAGGNFRKQGRSGQSKNN